MCNLGEAESKKFHGKKSHSNARLEISFNPVSIKFILYLRNLGFNEIK